MDFLKILKELTKDKQLTRSDICVMAVIVTYAQYADGQAVELSANDIHEEFETIPIRTIKRCVKHLSELHYIEIIKQAAPKPNKYKVLIPIPATQPKQIYQKKNTNKLNTDDEYIAQALQAMQKNPFMQ